MTNNAIAGLLTLICVLGGGSIVGLLVRDALTTGVFPYRGKSVRRDQQPVAFWFSVAFHIVCMLLLAAIGAYAVWRLTSGV